MPLIPASYINSAFPGISDKIDQHALVNLGRFLSIVGVSSKTWCLYDVRSHKMLGFRHGYNREIASLTKIMTTLLCIELIDNLSLSVCTSVNIQETKVRITCSASKLIGTTADLRERTYLTLKDLLYGAMLPSGNDAAYTLAEYFGYFQTCCSKGVQLDL